MRVQGGEAECAAVLVFEVCGAAFRAILRSPVLCARIHVLERSTGRQLEKLENVSECSVLQRGQM